MMKNGTVSSKGKWEELEIIMLNKVSQTRKGSFQHSPWHSGLQKETSMRGDYLTRESTSAKEKGKQESH